MYLLQGVAVMIKDVILQARGTKYRHTANKESQQGKEKPSFQFQTSKTFGKVLRPHSICVRGSS